MFIYTARYPYISGEKIPIQYYSILYRQLESIWRELVDFLKNNNLNYETHRHDIIVKVNDDLADETLTRLHISFMNIHGLYEGTRIDYRDYLNYLRRDYSLSISKLFLKLYQLIVSEEYDKAYEVAVSSIRKIAETENIYARTGRYIDQFLFEMLHGNIPQTYTNTYLLVLKGSEIVRSFAKEIFLEVAEKSYQIGMLLKKNIELMNKAEESPSNE